MARGKTEGAVEQGSEATESRIDNLVGRYVCKDRSFEGGAPLGKIASYDCVTKLFRVVYEDGRSEDLGGRPVSKILVADEGGSGMKISCRKRKLDQLVPSTPVSKSPSSRVTRSMKNAITVATDVPKVSSVNSVLGSDLSQVVDSSSDSCDYTRVTPSDDSLQPLKIPPLPPSSGDIAVADESVEYLFSVYNFLRSFSLQLFLSPFGLHEFFGALNCNTQNSLLDCVHVSLLRALRRHLEMLSLEGSELASKCLRHYNWALLDVLTWPAFLVEYLYVMGYMKSLKKEGIGMGILESEYYGLPVATKLKILQILCDDSIDSAELRTELGMRENLEEEKEFNVGTCDPLESETTPARVHPKHSKTSAWKNAQALESSVATNKPNPISRITEPGTCETDDNLDGNSDECRLCGMDGTLICCDGCPSAYHSRCIGLNKALLPNGLWLCPECTANKLGPASSRIGRGTRGAEVFGIDTYGRLYLGTCGYLLVIGISLNAEPVYRYYNKDDVAKYLNVIFLSEKSLSVHEDICIAISKYWQLQLDNMQTGTTVSIGDPHVDKEPVIGYVPSSITSAKVNVLYDGEGENRENKITEGSTDNKPIICHKDGCNRVAGDNPALDLLDQAGFRDPRKYDLEIHDVPNKTVPVVGNEISFAQNHASSTGDATKVVQKTLPLMHTKSTEQHGSRSVVTDVSYLNQPASAERLTMMDVATCASVNGSGICREDAGSSSFSKKNDSVGASCVSKPGSLIYDEKCGILSDKGLIDQAFFRPHAYMNHYVLGDIAATSAANLALLASEEVRVSEARSSSNPKKVLSANIALQMKAFSGAAVHFMWPNYDKKIVEVPRERCGWCIACKGASINKRGCFLNLAAANAIKGSARSISGIRPIKRAESRLPIIAAYIGNMEESLCGLLVGPFLDADYRGKWHKQVREASNYRVIKPLLLDLEKNIRGIAFSGDWFKLADDWPVESSAVLPGVSRAEPNHKHGSVGRKSKKQSMASKFVPVHNENGHYVQWRRGEKLSKVVFQKGVLPCSLVSKAARQGGRNWIPGINYSETSQLPRRSRQFAWRASVEMSKNVSQLALQVRYLDAYLKWRDLVRPDQTPLEGKVSDVDSTAFRNAVLCGKKIVENNRMAYALKFANQKHLPLRVTKNILEAEKTQDENRKLWFFENHIPLYLIKEYEEKAGEQMLPRPMMSDAQCLPNFQKNQLKSFRRDIFSYLFHKSEMSNQCLCPSCQGNVLLRDAVRCNICQDYCHKGCTTASTIDNEGDLEFVFTCHSCHRAKYSALAKSPIESLAGELPPEKKEQQLAHSKCIIPIKLPPPPLTGDKMEVWSSILGCKSVPKGKHKEQIQTYGLIWKKKKKKKELSNINGDLGKGDDELGKHFRLENIILKNEEGMNPLRRPDCCLCKQNYRPDLMYVRCETCVCWYHADALELKEPQIFDLVGFKCLKCRRKCSPKCPYDPKCKKPDTDPFEERNGISKSKRIRSMAPQSKVEDLVMVDRNSRLRFIGRVKPIDPMLEVKVQNRSKKRNEISISKHLKLEPQPRSEDLVLVDDDSLLHSMSQGQHDRGEISMGLEDSALSRGNDPGIETDETDFSAINEAKLMSPENDEVGWDSGYYGNGEFSDNPESGNNEKMEYEPQTYFSFTELLAEDEVSGNFIDLPIMDPSEVLGTGPAGTYSTEGSEPAFHRATCDNCKLDEPSPDLACEVCRVCIHSYCSPWVESKESVGDGQWRCGNCREWR